ncbi:MAG: RagB/SusD family nutrient uptake outer membrane protein [Dysgonamonadaceae bacterium]|jgi:hypothetical protein|nr:RagB/SusD family nutrient uptake outer membrane protein [Dysgonamonadaceae bacterium]MDD4591324.1 RagB/SusD family nutrient uptake outer membrane protein [Parabacteroides sp.]
MKNIGLYLMIVCLIGFNSCINDVLDKKPLDIISDDVLWNDANLVESYLAKQYENMHIFRFDAPTEPKNSWDHRGSHNTVTYISDETGPPVWSMANPRSVKVDGLTIHGGLLEWWDQAYSINRMLNILIEKLPESTNSQDFITSRVADARFLRAFNYFALVKRYGGVPLITKEIAIDAPDEEIYPQRNSEQEIYDFVISEMDDIEDVVKSFNTYGRVSQGAVLALKCRAALYAGSIAQFGTVQLNGLLGIPQEQASSYYQKSYDAAKKIIGLNKYALYNNDDNKVTNFKNIFLKEQNHEMIFARPCDKNYNYTFYGFLHCPKPHGYDAGMAGSPYLEIAESFEYIDGRPGTLDRNIIQQGLWSMEELWGDKDPRFHASIYTNETPWKDGKVDWHWGLIGSDGVMYDTEQDAFGGTPAWGNQRLGTNFGSGFGILKMLNEASDVNFTEWDDVDFPVFRFAEILLNLAEASFELGKADEALDAINQIRDRAGIAPKTSVDRDAIRQERKVELLFEGHRYWDVRRWRIATEKLSKPGSRLRYVLDYNTRKYKLIVYPDYDGPQTPPRFPKHTYYFPITLGRTGQNPNLLENPGYQ